MSLIEFVENYLEDHNLKLLPHQKDILKVITEGKMVCTVGSRSGKFVLAEAIAAHEEREMK